MGAPSSGLISELFLQQMEHVHLPRLSTKHKIIDYFRYMDDILLIFGSNHTDIQTVLNNVNAIHPKVKFTAELKTDTKIKLLRRNYSQNPYRLEDVHIQEAYIHRHDHTVHV
jgi:hypothetical protein